jgi:hypothetical protein
MPFSKDILAGSSGQGGGGFYDHQITNSCRFDSGDESGLRFGGASGTLGTPTNVQKGTYAVWLKRSKIGNDYQNIFHSHTGSSGRNIAFDLNGTDDTLGFEQGGSSSAKFQDTSAWYHFVFAFDTTQGSNDDRLKVYVNGSELDQFNASISGDVLLFQSGQQHWVGRNKGNGVGFDGYMADVIYVDGQQLAPTAFGETKEDPDGNNVWIPIDYAGTYGNNGYRLEFKQNGTGANSSGIGADTSGNDHHFALNGIGADHQSLDSPTFGG